ncbi:MAG TPA: MBL fold metallo-hydrolase [Vicinamibacterales bacterium]|nr:MBL fold metallo-hydrolase [Vicinamibacterales bacterium]
MRYLKSDHWDGQRFFNPYRKADRSLAEVFRWMRTREPSAWPADVALSPHDAPPASVAPGQVAITFIGHATFLLRTATSVFLTDPVFTSHAGPFGRLGPRRVRPPAIAPSALPPVDMILVSHTHYDHLQPSSLRLFRRASFVVPLGVGRYLPPEGGSYEAAEQAPSRGSHAPRERVASGFSRKNHELDWWQSATIGNAEITCMPAQHFSARTPWDRNETLWCGFVIRVDGVTIYFAGDSGYSPQFAEIGERCPAIDVALLPIGAYEPRWFMTAAHMNPDEAVRAHLDLRARTSIGMHFGTFQLTDEAIDEPLRALDRARVERGVTADAFCTLDFGETRVISAVPR